MAGFFSNLFGQKDKTRGRHQMGEAGAIASGVAGQAQPYGAAYDRGAAASFGADAGDYMRKATESARGLAEEQGRTAATQGTRAATQAARTSGLNRGQAALAGTQRAGDLYTTAQGQGLQSGIGNYMAGTGQIAGQGAEMAGRQLGASQLKAGIGGQQMAGGQAQQQATLGGIGKVAGAGASLLSDEGQKEDIQPAESIDELLAKIRPVTYDYKEGSGEPPGENLGVIAQDLEDTPLEGAVRETPRGKALDPAQLSGASLALIIKLNDRISELEEKIGGNTG